VSREDIEIVESAFAAWNRGDIAEFAGHTAEDVIWVEVSGRPEGPGGERQGRDRLRRSLEELFEAWESYRLELERAEPAGNRVLALVREVARGRASGVEVESRWGYLITVEGDEIARVEAYRDPEDALRAARTGTT
jgi:ketosteroid isomerase-like protein